MWILWALIVGLVVGAIAKLLMPGRDPGGCLLTIVIGIVGSLIGGFIGRVLGLYGDDVSAGGFFMSIIGALLLLWIARMWSRPRGT